MYQPIRHCWGVPDPASVKSGDRCSPGRRRNLEMRSSAVAEVPHYDNAATALMTIDEIERWPNAVI